MKHRMKQEDWFAHLDETVERLRAVDTTLFRAGARLRATVPVSTSAISAAKAQALARLGNQALSVRLGSLYLLLAPMCGVETSTRALCAAAHRVSAGSPQLLEEGAWPGFVEHLHTIVATLCGEPAAQLVRERGLRLQQEAA